jgi:hypothetical protein
MPQDSITKIVIDTIFYKITRNPHLESDSDKMFLGINKDYATLILIPIVSFLLALFFNWLKTKINLKSQLKTKEKYLFTWIDLISPQLKKQALLLREYSENIKATNPASLLFRQVNLHTEKFKIISSIELVQLFVTNRQSDYQISSQLLFDWENNISHLDKKLKNISEGFANYKNYKTEYTKDWNNCMTKLHESYIAFVQSEITEQATSNDANVIGITQQYNKWASQKIKNNTITIDCFIVPVEEYCKLFRKAHPKNEKILPFIMANTKLKRFYNDNLAIIDKYSAIFIQFSDDLEKVYNTIKDTKEKFEKIKLKSTFRLR